MRDGGESGVCIYVFCANTMCRYCRVHGNKHSVHLHTIFVKKSVYFVCELQYVCMYVRGCDLVTGHSLCACLREYIPRTSMLLMIVLSTGCSNTDNVYSHFISLLSVTHFRRQVFFGNTHNPQKCIFYVRFCFKQRLLTVFRKCLGLPMSHYVSLYQYCDGKGHHVSRLHFLTFPPIDLIFSAR